MSLPFMQRALEEAQKAFDRDEVPVGCVIAQGDEIIAITSNKMHGCKNPLGHAEILAIDQALSITKQNHLRDCSLYVTLEPCAMCAGAIALVGLKALYYGAYDPKMGQVDNNGQLLKNEPCEVYGGILESECSKLLRDFFKEKRLSNALLHKSE